ncbi:MAG: SRPBCC family protein [Phycisphaerales bacterium]
MPKTTPLDAAHASIELTYTINAPRDRVWKALVSQTAAWWPASFFTDPRSTGVSIEPGPGGRWVEHWGAGGRHGGVLWYTTLVWNPPHAIEAVGHISPDWGGPTVSMIKLTLEESGGTTTLRLTDALLGRTSDADLKSKRAGWDELFGVALKRHAENSETR